MIKLELTPEKFFELASKGYSLDMIYLLKMFELEYFEEVEKLLSAKTVALETTLLRKNLISNNRKITLSGKELLSFLSTSTETKIKKKSKEIDGFDLWWKEFPSSDTFEYKGKKFSGSRALKAKKDDCKVKFKAILNEGEVTTDILIEAIKLEVAQKKEKSYKTGQNCLSYIQNSSTYLNQRSFEGYVELVKSGIKSEEIKEKVANSVDI